MFQKLLLIVMLIWCSPRNCLSQHAPSSLKTIGSSSQQHDQITQVQIKENSTQGLIKENSIKETDKKILCWPAVEPTPEFLLNHLGRVRELPFDGYILRILDDQNQQVMWETWGKKELKIENLTLAHKQLTKLHEKYQGEIFLRINVTPGDVDWSDDQAWKIVENNIHVIAILARETKCAGILFDTEQYLHQPFNYNQQPAREKINKEKMEFIVQQRGKQLGEKIQKELSPACILITFGYYAAQVNVGDGRKEVNYELLAPLLDGMLSSLDNKSTIIDGWEYSYDYKKEDEFTAAKNKLHEAVPKVSRIKTGNADNGNRLPEKYSQSFGLWLDYHQKVPKWDQVDFKNNHFTPEEFRLSLKLALKHSSKYVWIYSQQPDWFTGKDLPPAYLESCRKIDKTP